MDKGTILFGALAGALLLGGVGCKASLEPQGGTGGVTGTGGITGIGATGTGGSSPPGTSFPLPSTSTGFVDDPVTGVVGPGYAYGDGVGPNASPATTDSANSDCVLDGGFMLSQCSQITTPTPGQPFPPTDPATSKMCTSGVAAQVLPKNGSPDYADLWGAGIGINFNEPLLDGSTAFGNFDMSPYTGIAFDFSADVLPAQSMRVSFLFQGMHGGDAPYWMGATMQASPLTGTTANPQHVEIKWADVGGPFYLSQIVPPVDVTQFPFDPTRVEAMQFQVFTNTAVTTPYSFCVSNLALLGK